VTCRTSLSLDVLRMMPGVIRLDPQADGVRLITSNAEATARALLAQDATVSGLEVRSVGLEDAFLALTGADDTRAAVA
jgi:ABC-2 type transport system ATP-binding protein